MAAPVIVTGLMATVVITDSEGHPLGTSESPLEMRSSELNDLVVENTEETRKVRETLENIFM